MRAVKVFLTLIALSLASPVGSAHAQVDVDMSLGEEGLRGFYLGVGEYYRVPQREVIIIRERHIPTEEIPVILLIAQRARVAPATVIDLRLRGRSWWDITIHYGLGPEIYYVPIPATVRVGPPYGKAYGYYRNKPRKEWRTIVLRDDEVINLVNLKFVSEHYRRRPEEIIRLRSRGKDFVVINHEVRKNGRDGRFARRDDDRREMKEVKGKGHEKGKGEEFTDRRDDDQRGKGQQKGKGYEMGKGHQRDID